MNKPDFSPSLLSMKEMNLHQKLKYLTFLQKEGEETVYVAAIMCLISSFQQVLPTELEDMKVKKSLIQHFTNFSGKLLINRKFAKALSVLEFALKQFPKATTMDAHFQNLCALIHNNLAVYSANIHEYDLAAKSLHICFKKDSGLDINLTCIFHNNLAGVYQANGSYEKAYKCAKKCVFLLQPLIFDQIRSVPQDVLKKDTKFKKSLIILLIGYINIAGSIQGHRTLDLTEGPVLREMLDADPKSYYSNSFRLANKFLGKDHFLFQRIAISLQRFEENEEIESETPYSKKAFHSDQSSEIERNQSTAKYPTKPYRKAEEINSPLTDRAYSKDRLEDLGGYQAQKSFRIRETSLTKQAHQRKQSVDMTPSKTSLDATLGILNHTPRDTRLASDLFTQNPAHKNHRRFKSTTAEFNEILKKEGVNAAWPNFNLRGNMTPLNQNQPYLHSILQQQKELYGQLGQKHVVHKQSFPSIDDNDGRMSLKAQEDALKIEKLQQEIDGLKQTFREFEAKNLVREDSKSLSDAKQPSLSSLGPHVYHPAKQEPLVTLLKGSSVVSASSRDELNKNQGIQKNKQVDEYPSKRDSFMMVLPIPTSIEALDSQMFEISATSANTNRLKYATFRQQVDLGDGSDYFLVCKAVWTKEKKLFNLELVKASSTNSYDGQVIHKKQLNYKELQAVLKQIQYKDSLPTSFQLKEIRNFFPLIKFLLMPFASIKTNQEGVQQITVTSQPSNILTGFGKPLTTITFMRKECTLLFLHIINNTFRVILTDINSVEDSLRIDIELDADSINHYFKKRAGHQSDLRSASASVKIIQAFDDYSDENELLAAKKLLGKINDPERTEEEELDSYKLANAVFNDDLCVYIHEVEKFFMAKEVLTFKDVLSEKQVKYCKISITNLAKKACLHVVWDKPDQNLFEVSLNNLYESFAPNGKAKVKGTYKYPYKTASKHFGLLCEKMEQCDKLSLCSIIADLFVLEVFEKKLSPEEIERYDLNPITFGQIETGTYYRTYLGTDLCRLLITLKGSGTKFPLTFSLMGIKGVPRGVKVTLYNREEITEQGSFFHINYNCWVKDLNERKKRRTYSVDPFEIIDYYHLESIFKTGGWKILQEALAIDTNSKKMKIIGIKIMKGISVMEQLENILNPESLLKLLKTKEEANDD